MKIAALAITLALWFGVTGLSRPTAQRFSSIPLATRYSNNIEVTNSPIQEINLVISGDSRRLAQLNEKQLVASIDVSSVPPGDRVVPLTSETVVLTLTNGLPLPPGLKVDEIQPRSMAVRVEAVEEREVPVQPEFMGEVASGYEVYSMSSTPARVKVRGPSRFIRSLEAVPTGRVDLASRNADFTSRQVPLSLENPKASLVEVSAVDVAVRVGEKRVERVYSVPVSGSTRHATVVLYGPRSIFENISVEDLRVEAGDDVPPRVILPPELEGVVEKRSVKVRGQ